MFIRLYWKVFAWSLLMLILFIAPSRSLPEGPGFPMFDKIVHILLFGVFTSLLILARFRQKQDFHIRFPLVLHTFFTALLFGILIELIQLWMNMGREGSIADVLADMAGYFAGLGLIWIYKIN